MTNASTVAMNSSYPWGSPPPGGRKSRSPLARAMKPSTLVPIKTVAFTVAFARCCLTLRFTLRPPWVGFFSSRPRVPSEGLCYSLEAEA